MNDFIGYTICFFSKIEVEMISDVYRIIFQMDYFRKKVNEVVERIFESILVFDMIIWFLF